MVVVGALIGGFTNFLAIKMLFRPYRTFYIGKWRVPFTPGLIPKRRGELADQLGKMVVEHLITPESVQKKFLQDGFQNDMKELIQRETERVLSMDRTPEELLQKLGIHDATARLLHKIDGTIESKYETIMEMYRTKPLDEVIPNVFLEKIDEKIPLTSEYILKKGIDYFTSPEGKLRIQRMIDDFLKERSGMLGNMLQMVLGNVNLVDKIQPEIIKFLKNEGTKDIITTLIKNEWQKLLQFDVAYFEDLITKEKGLTIFKNTAHSLLRVDQFMQTPLHELVVPFKDTLLNDLAPSSVTLLGSWLSERIEVIMNKLHLAEVVKEQVESFSLERLEEMILMIAKKELKMITYLGALLGGIIGVIQALFVLLVQ